MRHEGASLLECWLTGSSPALRVAAITSCTSPAPTPLVFTSCSALCLRRRLTEQVFKAAHALAPSVVLVEDVDHVFLTDRARAALVTPPGGEPPSRIRKALVAEVRRGAELVARTPQGAAALGCWQSTGLMLWQNTCVACTPP